MTEDGTAVLKATQFPGHTKPEATMGILGIWKDELDVSYLRMYRIVKGGG